MASISGLLQWCKENGTLLSPRVEFKNIDATNIGGFFQNSEKEAADDLEDEHIRLPLKLAITVSDAIKSFSDGNEADTFTNISNKTSNINSLLKLFLAREKSEKYLSKSFYQPYLTLLPSLTDINSPYTWSPEDKESLRGTNLGSALKENLAALVEEWWQVINLLPESIDKPEQHFVNMKFYYEFKFHQEKDLYELFNTEQDFNNWTSFTNYLWSSLILKSRSFPAYLIKNVDKEKDIKMDEAMLLPVVDLLNHSMKADVEWSVTRTGGTDFFNFKSNSALVGRELFNNYGRKGNEELLLAYGFCIEGNEADTTALKIKIPVEMLPELEQAGVKLPRLSDYTTAVVRTDEPTPDNKGDYSEFSDGLLFFVTVNNVPENLISLFQQLVKTPWETDITLRTKLAGINHLRQALESKITIINEIKKPSAQSANTRNIDIYVSSQKQILNSAVKILKRKEKDILVDPEVKPNLVTLKTVYKKDKKFADALLVSLGVTSYEQLIEHSFQDQAWLLFLIRCHNKKEYADEEENYLPDWIHDSFERMTKEHTITAEEIVQYQELYESLVIPLTSTAPDVFNRGVWTVEQLIISARLLDTISFVRGKKQECILVKT
ncbi:hypothetical protein PSN45_003240 [Yamadazyma tenuis]|uniref:Uncharacterized protein n=1 Tax=Candida tenuis (strain ATCC 10573 / BCRC 21748 / CBS 615 / JCM 9827 / NBRC 10315 / NRRL Y-1498 / VKM Y-70) TaxID=590646 RepID=G3AYX5_CANTC|nr:uncharacterized protein CANTEDRAFT_101893 [Yamadazyma tenuis ATCC 10573]EGV65954.1 hypothetical protein CANTEDRAFT_101893 [Yamadazyma tenuis ATCC 10573]WEJ95713.1 hypothetical protein PSN45_003240 [Yamadazyma tenuis]